MLLGGKFSLLGYNDTTVWLDDCRAKERCDWWRVWFITVTLACDWTAAELKNAVIGGEFGSSRDPCILDARFRNVQRIVSQSRGFVCLLSLMMMMMML